MNLQRVIRVALCAAIIAPGIGGALSLRQLIANRKAGISPLRGAAAIERLKQEGQYESLETAFNEARFSVSHAEKTPLGRSAWHAPNPAAGYDAYVTDAGVSIAVNDNSPVGLRLHSIGYGKNMRLVAGGQVSGDKQSISITRDGAVREWYVNGPDGLEQGFTLMERPNGLQEGVPLRLALQISEGWHAEARDDKQMVTLRGSGGDAVEYSKLVVLDPLGRDIPARLNVAEENVIIEVEDSNAIYPLTIDPLFTLEQKIVMADGAFDDLFGTSVALNGDTLAVGAWGGVAGKKGAVYVFTRTGGAWALQQKLVAPGDTGYFSFGLAIALSGDTLVAGASGESIGTTYARGSAYVFTRSGLVWTQQQKLIAGDGAAVDQFGIEVALSGDTTVIGASGDDVGANENQGSAYVFTRVDGVWSEQQKLTISPGAPNIAFGHSLSVDGDTIVAGASRESSVGYLRRGAAHIFTRSGTLWTYQQRLTAADAGAEDQFGIDVAVQDDTMAIGAWGADIGLNASQGAVYTFTRTGGYWSQQQKLTASDGAMYDAFGRSVSIHDNSLVVGATGDTTNGNIYQGSAYYFSRNTGVWTQRQKLIASDGATYDGYGHSVAVAVDGDHLVVGVYSDDIGVNENQGSVYTYLRPRSQSRLPFQPEREMFDKLPACRIIEDE